MSQRIYNNEQYRFVVGVDHVTSSFFQIWKQPADDQDIPLLVADNQGVRSCDDDKALTQRLRRMILTLEKRYEISRQKGNRYPNLTALDIDQFAKECGFTNILSEIYNILD